MRIITGKYKGRAIKMPKGIRPTQDKVRKAIFDILGDMHGLYFLELFAGSGAVGIEALSRGARGAVFVENNSDCLRALKENLLSISANDCLVLPVDAEKVLERFKRQGRKFDIIFLDPPYYQDMAKKTLQTRSCCDILAPDGIIVVQHFKKDNLPYATGDLALLKQAAYGDTMLSFYRMTA
jgi:16S rRNA (guanine966-N2)-methyltransferase